MTKPRVGFYGLTGCAGCLLSVIFNEEELLDIIGAVDIVAFPFIKGENDNECELDIAFVEGTVVSNEDEEMILKIRKRAKVVVSLGACACIGCIPSEKMFLTKEEFDRLDYKKVSRISDCPLGPRPLHKVISVNVSIPGCPPDRDEIKTCIKDLLLGKTFRNYTDPVCMECKLNENGCLLDEGEICLGPITTGGCDAICPTKGLKCYGCRGLTNDVNFDEYFTLLESKGKSAREVKQIMETFMSIEIREALKGTKWENA